MKYLGVILIIFSLLLSTLAVADLSGDVAKFGQSLIGTKLTGVAGSMLKNERVNIYIKEGEATKVFSLITEKMVVTSLTEEELKDPTLKVFTDVDAFNNIKNSVNPYNELKKALDEGKITYEAVGFFKKIKFGFSNFFTKLFGGSKEDNTKVKNETTEDKKGEQQPQKNETVQKEEPKIEKKNETSSEKNQTKEPETEVKGETHTVLLQNTGFSPVTLTIKVGDTVKWKVSRSGNFKNGMILGTQNCVAIKSKILNVGEEFEWTFDKAETCTFVDGIITTQISKVIVE